MSVVEAKDVTTVIVVGVAVLVCTVLNLAVLYVVLLVEVVMLAVSDPLVIVMDALCVKGMMALLVSNIMGGIVEAREVIVTSLLDMVDL